jgi:hypothetical protein
MQQQMMSDLVSACDVSTAVLLVYHWLHSALRYALPTFLSQVEVA